MAEKHFYEQQKHTQTYLTPYFEKHILDFKEKKILEVGCAEAGFLDALAEQGVDVTGIEIDGGRVEMIKQKNPSIKVLVGDIADPATVDMINKKFDVIVIRDVIEHIPNKLAAFENMKKLLNKDGYIFIAFPPKFSAFSGHQQGCTTIMKIFPFIHLLPTGLIRFFGKMLGELEVHTESIIENYKNALSINRFEEIYKEFSFEPVVKEIFLFRPVYRVRFNVNPRKLPNIPVFREIFAFGCEYLLKKK